MGLYRVYGTNPHQYEEIEADTVQYTDDELIFSDEAGQEVAVFFTANLFGYVKLQDEE